VPCRKQGDEGPIPSRISTMTPQEYIQQELNKQKDFRPQEIAKENLADEIFRLIMSKKFRKYSAKPQLIEQIKRAIQINIENNQPINFTFPHGAYKLWRLEEAPLPDWAELFTAMYYTKWIKPVCEIYNPGVWFDYYVDDYIIPKIDNISLEVVDTYIKDYQKMFDFLKQYQPDNLKMTITEFRNYFSSHEAFEESLQECVKKLSSTNPTFTEEKLQVVELNAKPTPEQLKDPHWREKIRLVHDAYISMKREIGYYFKPTKIPVFCQPLTSGMFLAVGTTKTSIAKFWVGAGALKKIGDSYIEYILSPKQLKTEKLTKEPVSIAGLDSRNFRVINTFS
jgi:hypothetical protein